MKTAEQINAPQTGSVRLSSDEIRSRLIGTFEQFKATLDQYYDYAQRAAALAEEYHDARLVEVFGVPIEEAVLVATLDARETPKSLDNFIAGFKSDRPVRRILFDRAASKYYVYV